jgi:hypothetical protein
MPDIRNAFLIAKALDVSVEYLADDDQVEPTDGAYHELAVDELILLDIYRDYRSEYGAAKALRRILESCVAPSSSGSHGRKSAEALAKFHESIEVVDRAMTEYGRRRAEDTDTYEISYAHVFAVWEAVLPRVGKLAYPLSRVESFRVEEPNIVVIELAPQHYWINDEFGPDGTTILSYAFSEVLQTPVRVEVDKLRPPARARGTTILDRLWGSSSEFREWPPRGSLESQEIDATIDPEALSIVDSEKISEVWAELLRRPKTELERAVSRTVPVGFAPHIGLQVSIPKDLDFEQQPFGPDDMRHHIQRFLKRKFKVDVPVRLQQKLPPPATSKGRTSD